MMQRLVHTFSGHRFYADLQATLHCSGQTHVFSSTKWSEFLVLQNIPNPGINDLSNWMEIHSLACEHLQVPTASLTTDPETKPRINYS